MEGFIKIKHKRATFYTDYNIVKFKDSLRFYSYNEFKKDFLLPYGFIYIITNIFNNKQYVGQTTRSPFQRFTSHIKFNPRKTNLSLLQKAILKYGKNLFEMEVLKNCSTQEELNKWEAYYIKKYNTCKLGYNIIGGSPCEYNIMKDNSLYKIWINKYGIKKANKLLNTFKNKQKILGRLNVKTRNLTFKGHHHTKETKYKLSQNRLGSDNPMYGKNPYSIWENKYGKEEADRRQAICIQKRKNTRLKNRTI